MDISVLLEEVRLFKGGNIKGKINEWKQITSDSFILDIVTKGLQLEFIDGIVPKQTSFPKIRYSTEERLFLESGVNTLLSKDIICKSTKEPNDFISTLFTRPKKDGSRRMILNLKKLNENIIYKHFKMESLSTAFECMRQGCLMGSVDLKDAFFTIPIYEPHQKFLKFYFDGELYQFKCMPQGYGPSMRIFTKVLKPVFSRLRELGFISAVYVDDNLLFGDFFEECYNNILSTVHLLRNVGYTIHVIKSILVPILEITFLGFVLNSANMTVTLLQEKKEKIRSMCLEILNNPHITIRKLACLIGNFISAMPAIPYGRLHYRALETSKIIALKQNAGDFDSTLSLNEANLQEITWWSNNIMKATADINLPPIDKTIFTDASSLGWGIHHNGVSNGIRWNTEEQELHINILELKAIFNGLKSFCSDMHKVHIKVMSDNTTAIAYVNNMGGIRSIECDKIAKSIWNWCKARSIWITAAYIPGLDNIEADTASRKFKEATEWMLSTNVFRSITKEFGMPTVDLFASALNKQLDKYVSWKPDPGAVVIDAFSCDWKNEFFYIFPPFSLIGKVLQKLERDKSQAIIVTPVWTTQPWYPRLVKKSSKIITFPPSKRLLTLPSTDKIHPIWDKLKLMACLIN